MNAAEWLHSRTPRPPATLTNRLDVLLAEQDSLGAVDIPDALHLTVDRLLDNLLRREASSRGSALDLLAADALMTYLMECVAEDIHSLDARAVVAMRRISTTLDDAAPAT